MSNEETEPEEAPETIDPATMEGAPVIRTGQEQRPVKLTGEEVITRRAQQDERWVEMRDLLDAEESHRSAEKDRKKAFDARRDASMADYDRGQRVIAAGAEDRQVEVKTFAILDGPPDSNVAIKLRIDTGQVLNRRALTPTELDKLAQGTLPLAGGDADLSDGGEVEPVVEPLTIEGVTFADPDPVAVLAFVNEARVSALRGAGFSSSEAMGILDGRPHADLQAIRQAVEAPPEPRPTGARDLVRYIERGRADDALDALAIDTRKSVGKAIKARRAVLAAAELPPEAGETAPEVVT